MGRQTTADSEAKTGRLSLPLTDQGTVDWDRVRPSTAQKFIDILKTDAKVREEMDEMSGSKPDASALFDGITSENVGAALDILSQANALMFKMGAARWIKHPLLRTVDGKPVPLVLDQDILTKAFAFTKEQHAELDPRATRIAQKHSHVLPPWVRDNMDLIMLGGMFLKYTAENAQAALRAQVMRDIARHEASAPKIDKKPASDDDARRMADETIAKQKQAATPPQRVNGHDRASEPLEDILYARDAISHSEVDPPETPIV